MRFKVAEEVFLSRMKSFESIFPFLFFFSICILLNSLKLCNSAQLP